MPRHHAGGSVAPAPSSGGKLLGDYRYKVYARARDFSRVAEVDDFSSLAYVLRLNGVGSWTLEVPADSASAEALSAEGAGVQIVRNGSTVLSGPVRNLHEAWSADTAPNAVLTVSGPDDMCWIAGRLALPDPDGPPFNTQDFDVRTGVASTVILDYVDANAGPSARPERAVPGLTLAADPVAGVSVYGRARFDNLLDVLGGLADVDGTVAFRCRQEGGGLTFEVYEVVDRSSSVEFSRRRGNVSAYDRELAGPEANMEYAGGDGGGTSRTFKLGDDAPSVTTWGRIEGFLSSTGTTNAAELAQAIDADLATKAPSTVISVVATDTEGTSFGRDYDLGDRVTATAGDVTITDLVREVDVEYTVERGEGVTVTVGSPNVVPPDSIEQLISGPTKRIGRRQDKLERRT